MAKFPKKFMGKTYEQKQADAEKAKCSACAGSGFYDHFIKGRVPKCGACGGTGLA